MEKYLKYKLEVFFNPGGKRSWFRLGSLKSSGKPSTMKVTESQIRLVADVCVMYQTMLVTFSQIRLDILTGNWFPV